MPTVPSTGARRAAIRVAMADREPLGGGPIRMEVAYQRANRQGDALNMMNGIADVLQQRTTFASCAGDVWAIDDDHNIREFSYQEIPALRDSYQVRLSRVEERARPS
ncbi:MAG: hypothetical protein JWM80_795 [Cyanobacteria bacterium RYN_339]|nr:hypothetical protein [Cyanobacteria bacterium RYN_339]